MCVVRLFGVMDVRTRNIRVCSAFASAHGFKQDCGSSALQ